MLESYDNISTQYLSSRHVKVQIRDAFLSLQTAQRRISTRVLYQSRCPLRDAYPAPSPSPSPVVSVNRVGGVCTCVMPLRAANGGHSPAPNPLRYLTQASRVRRMRRRPIQVRLSPGLLPSFRSASAAVVVKSTCRCPDYGYCVRPPTAVLPPPSWLPQ